LKKLIDNYLTCIHTLIQHRTTTCKETLLSRQVQLGAAGAIDTPDLRVVSSQPAQPRSQECGRSFHNIVSLATSTSKKLLFPFHYRLLVSTGFSYRFPGLVVSERARYRNRAKGACDDLILLLHSLLTSHWSNASSPFIITTFNRHKA
jgi:hypothetical protein